MSRLTRLLLALYPAEIRRRYGEEIADMLRTSPRPWRDAADVAWCALTERLSRPRARWLVPIALVGAIGLWFWEPVLYQHTLGVWMILLGVAVGSRLGRKARGPWYQHPLAIAIWFGLSWFIPFENLGARVVGYLCWIAASIGLAWAVVRIHGRARLAVAVIGWILLLQTMSVAWIGYQRGIDGRTLLWFPTMLVGIDLDLGDPILYPVDPFAIALLTPCLALMLSYAYRVGRLRAVAV